MDTAVVGLGSMGRRHLRIAQDLGLRIVAVADLSQDVLAEVGDTFAIPRARRFTDVEELLACTGAACVIIATTAPTHCLYTCMAARAGVRYVLCEKPMAVSLAQCDEMLTVCHEREVRLAINHQMRFMPYYQESKRIVESDEFGGLTSVTVIGGNCGMAMNGLHYFEMFRYLTNEPSVEVTAWLSPESIASPRGAEFEDRAGAVRLTTATGRRFYMEIGADQGHGLKVICGGPRGQLVVDELAGTIQLSLREAAHRSEPTTRYGLPSVDSVRTLPSLEIVRSTAAVLGALLAGEDVPNGNDARLVVSILVAAYVSHEQAHRPVRLEECLPRELVFAWA